jgi:hypothetical protein
LFSQIGVIWKVLFVAKKINPYICKAQQKGNLVKYEDSTRCCNAYPARGYLRKPLPFGGKARDLKAKSENC